MTGPEPWRATTRRAQQAQVIVSNPIWGGGVHRDHLAYLMRLDSLDQRFRIALAVAAKKGMITFCRGYVCAVPPEPIGGAPVTAAAAGTGPGSRVRTDAKKTTAPVFPPALFVEGSTTV